MRIELVLAAAALVALGACERNEAERTHTTGASRDDQPRVREPPAGNGDVPAPRRTELVHTEAARITEARCTRELACGDVGTGKHWADLASCRDELGRDMDKALAASQCKAPVADHVESCISVVRTTSCDNVSSINRIEACRPKTLCGP